MAFQPSAIFNLLEGDANYRKIIAQITTVPPPGIQVYNVYFEVQGPVAPLKLPNFASPDGTMDNGNPTAVMAAVGLPLDSTGSTMEGTYVLKYHIEDTSAPGVYTVVSHSIDLDVLKEGPEDCRIQGQLDVDVNCVCFELTVTDNTYYGDESEITLDSRSIEVVLPKIPGQAQPAPVTTTDKSITLGFDYSNVTYTINLVSVYHHYNTDETIEVQENLIATRSVEVVCDFNLCKLTECINAKLLSLEKKAARVGGWPNLPLDERDFVAQLNNYMIMMNLYRTCGNYNKVYEVYNIISDLVGCDCGCGGENGKKGNTNHPIPVSPACGGAGGNITAVNGTYPVVVNQAGTTATISLHADFVNAALLQGVTALNLTAPIQGSLTGGGVNPLVLNLNIDTAYFGWSAWTVFNDTYVVAVASIVEYSTVPLPLRVSTNSFTGEMRVDGQFNALQYASPICLNVDINLSLPAGIRTGMPIPAFNNSGDCVGYVAIVGAFGGGPTDYRLFFYPNSNFVAPSIVSINGRFNLS